MTVVNELADRGRYFELQLVEFYEFLCRLSHHLYNDEIVDANIPAASSGHGRAPDSQSHREQLPSLFIGVELLLEKLLARLHLTVVRAAEGLQQHYAQNEDLLSD